MRISRHDALSCRLLDTKASFQILGSLMFEEVSECKASGYFTQAFD